MMPLTMMAITPMEAGGYSHQAAAAEQRAQTAMMGILRRRLQTQSVMMVMRRNARFRWCGTP